LKNILITLLFVYVIALSYLYFYQDKLIFANRYTKSYAPLKVKTIKFKTSDGLILEGGYIDHGKDLPLVLYFGGNGVNILQFLDETASKIQEYNFVAFNYPGYGKSEGKPSEKLIEKYALEIAQKYKPKHIIGRSLGSAVASFVASKVDSDTLLLITPFDSIENVARHKYPIFPVSLILKHKFKELNYLKSSHAKKINAIFVKEDEVIPQKSIESIQNSIKFDKSKTIDASHSLIYMHPDIAKIIEQMLGA